MKTSLQGLAPALEHYDLRPSAAWEISHGFNLHYRVATAEGDKHLIIYHQQPGHPPRQLSHQIREHLRRHGFTRAAGTVPTIDGTPFAKTPLGTAAVIDWLPGTSGSLIGDWPLELVRQAGTMLADLHRALVDLRPAPPDASTLGPLYLPADAWIARTPALLADFEEWVDEPDPVVRRVAERLDEALAMFRAEDYAAARDGRPRLVHGDYRPANLLVEDGHIVAVLDFDSAFWESRLYDVAYACFQFVGIEGIYPQERIEPAVAFVEAYAARWPLDEPERRLFPFFLRQVVLKRLLAGRLIDPRLRLLDQIDGELGAALIEAAQTEGAPAGGAAG